MKLSDLDAINGLAAEKKDIEVFLDTTKSSITLNLTTNGTGGHHGTTSKTVIREIRRSLEMRVGLIQETLRSMGVEA